ncbi:hypothetical protein PSI15_14560 [Xenorhabdus sp. PR6a]|uniref:hypothetical protein n=1 Tax=Xenorhabdus sp. PR6a TaxID=3025877 RepID=UPI00235A3FD7|nr:hypothetical protein [Xenorhabdus sp. PR6a]MDC9582772.1 hypothetical protein [Xenorhabdus sp. PR6a]
MSKHPHADLMMKAAEIAQTNAKWWEWFQRFDCHYTEGDVTKELWVDIHESFDFDPDEEYKFREKVIIIGNIDVPEPEREQLGHGKVYYYPILGFDSLLYECSEWYGLPYDEIRLKRGLIHLDRESAELHAKALIALTENK